MATEAPPAFNAAAATGPPQQQVPAFNAAAATGPPQQQVVVGGAPMLQPGQVAVAVGLGVDFFGAYPQGVAVKQQIEVLEALSGCETNNKYEIMGNGIKVGTATEDTGCCERQCCKNLRGFNITLTDLGGHPVMSVRRPIRCQDSWCGGMCCCPINCCCLQRVTIFGPDGITEIGHVVQRWVPSCRAKLRLIDSSGRTFANVYGPLCACKCCCKVTFDVFEGGTRDKACGTIGTEWGGFIKEAFTAADDFGVAWPEAFTNEQRAIMIGATFLLDFMYFENSGN